MPLKVYYLDDEPELCENFADCFSSECVEVFTFTDAIKAIEFIRSQPPDILFVDFRLSGTTGDRVAQDLNPQFPVYLITGDLTVQSRFQFKKVFSKPVNEAELLALIQSYQT